MRPPNTGGEVTQKVKWPDWVREPMQMSMKEGTKLYERGKKMTPPPLDPATLESIQNKYNMAKAGSPIAREAIAESGKILRGEYLTGGSNPYIQQVADRAVGQGMGDVAKRMSGSGRVGSGAYANSLGETAMNTRASIYGANYDAERGRMMQGLSMAPQAYGLGYADTAQMEDVGRTREAEAQRQFDWPWENLDRFNSTVYGNPGTRVPSTKTSKSFDWGAAIGGMLSPQSGGGGMMGGGGR